MEYNVYCDSQSAIDLSKNSMYHARTNTLTSDIIGFVRKWRMNHFTSKRFTQVKNPANMLTKMIPKDKFELCKELLGISSL